MAEKAHTHSPHLLGIDGCKGGWLVCRRELATSTLSFFCVSRLSKALLEAASAAAIDMPIGLSDEGPRRCDIEARKALPGRRGAAVFNAPRRYQLRAGSYSEANEAGKTREGVGVSKQSWNLFTKIAELDRLMTPALQKHVREVHPELVFNRLAKGKPLPTKKLPLGQERRRALLEGAGLKDLKAAIAAAGLPRGMALPDDYLDAAALAEAAGRIHDGEITVLPAAPDKDRRKLRMEICF